RRCSIWSARWSTARWPHRWGTSPPRRSSWSSGTEWWPKGRGRRRSRRLWPERVARARWSAWCPAATSTPRSSPRSFGARPREGLGHEREPAPRGALLHHDLGELLGQLGNVGDHPDQAPVAGQLLDGLGDRAKTLGVQGPEPLVQEQAVQAGPVGHRERPDLVRQGQGQAERGQEGLAAGQGADAALLVAVPGVHHQELVVPAEQTVAAVGQALEAVRAGRRQELERFGLEERDQAVGPQLEGQRLEHAGPRRELLDLLGEALLAHELLGQL